jgi:hypothetical protein
MRHRTTNTADVGVDKRWKFTDFSKLIGAHARWQKLQLLRHSLEQCGTEISGFSTSLGHVRGKQSSARLNQAKSEGNRESKK